MNLFKQVRDNPLVPLILVLLMLIALTVILSSQDPTPLKPDNMENNFSTVTLIDHSEPKKIQRNTNDSMQDPNIPKILKEGIDLWNSGELFGAEDKLRTVLLFQPTNPLALNYLILLYAHLGRYAEAEMLARARAKALPGDPYGYIQLSGIQLHLGNVKNALTSGKKAFRMDPNSSSAALNLARIYAQVGERGLCLHYLKIAISNNKNHPLQELIWDPVFDELRQTPEFQKVITKAIADEHENIHQDSSIK